MQYQQGAISSENYYQAINQIENEIIEAVQELKSKMLDHMEDSILDGEFKMVDIKKD
ncbi:MAG: hypothetical protein KDD45_17080 [Bdellovibrionales bacterium]|nr:hypothetical protein [Bdellovibrionales bacterium]